MSTATSSGRVVRGALYMVAMVACLALDAAVVRLVSTDIHPFEIALFRSVLSLPIFMPWIAAVGFDAFRTPHFPLHGLRAILKFAGLVGFLYAITLLPLATVTAFGFATPLFVAVGCILFLGEKPHARRLVTMALGTVGVYIVFMPSPDAWWVGIVVAIGSAVALGGSGMIVKYLSTREDPRKVVALNTLMIIPLALVCSIPVWVTPDLKTLGLLLVQGICGGISQLCYSRAMALTDASIIAPLEFLRLPFVAILAWLLFSEVPTLSALIGGAVIFVATLASVEWERRAAIARELP